MERAKHKQIKNLQTNRQTDNICAGVYMQPEGRQTDIQTDTNKGRKMDIQSDL